jgi:peptide/nickel transport system substrate-binding protein
MAIALPALAQELKIGLRSEPSALDPQYQNSVANNQIALHIFDPLVARDAQLRPVPGLALSWRPISDTVWEFKLRPGVKFHDGSPFTAQDVVFTFERAARVPNSPAPFTPITRQISRLEIVDPLTLRITTSAPAPLLPMDLGSLPILSHRAAAGGAPEGRTTAELNRGEGLAGTGPFRFVEWKRGADLLLVRNDDYWGGKPAWSKVLLRALGNGSVRLAALSVGDVDLVEEPPPTDVPKLRRDTRVAVAEAVTHRLIYIALDQFAAPSPGIAGTEGKNPLKDKRVREALSRAIDRKAIVDKTLDGLGVPAAELLPWPAFGTSKEAQPDRFDTAQARKLLADAGWGKGFSLTLAAPNGRYLGDVKVAQAIATMWNQAGVKAQAETPEPQIFFKNRDENRYSAYIAGWTGETGELSNPLRALAATLNRERGAGVVNRGRYSNSEVDARLDEALRTVDDKKREALLQQASRLVATDYGVLPLYFEMAVWAMRRDLAYAARADQMTLAQFVTTRPVSR